MMRMMGYDDEYYEDDDGEEEVGECCSYPSRRHNTSFQEFRFIQAIRIPPHKRTVQVSKSGLWQKKKNLRCPIFVLSKMLVKGRK